MNAATLPPIVEQAPCAALRVWCDGERWDGVCNEAARRLLPAAGMAEWLALLAPLLPLLGDTPQEARVRLPGGVDAQAQALRFDAASWLVWLSPHSNDAPARAAELARRLEILADAAGVGLWAVYAKRVHVEWDAAAATMQGLPIERKMTWAEWIDTLVHPDDRPLVSQHGRDTARSHSDDNEIEFRIVRPDGELRWLHMRGRRDVSGGDTVYYGVVRDVTERHRTEAALADANQRAALAVRGAGMGTWEQDLASLTVHWDEQMFRLRGLEPEGTLAPIGRGRELVHPDDRPRVLVAWNEALRTGEPVSYEFRVRWPDGSMHWLASRLASLKNEQGEVVRQIGVNWDITAAKVADAAREQQALALRESQAKSQFLAHMSHELRTPLNAVLGFTQLLQLEIDGTALQPGQRAKLEHVRNAGEHLLSLITDVLDLSSLEAGGMRLKLEPVALADVLAEALPLMQPLARKHRVELKPAPHVPGLVLADRTRLRQVLLNLLSNAIKYNRSQGSVLLSSQIGRDGVTLRIADTGRGMTPEQLAHLFEPFNRLGHEGGTIEGSGIGLAIVKALVDGMGGEVSLTSVPNQGSEVRLRLPAATRGIEPTTTLRRPGETSFAELVALGRRPPEARILYIEDNPVNVMLVEELVATRPALRLVCETTGEAGVRRALELMPDLVLVDMRLPDFDGIEVLRRLRAEPATAEIPCIALSADALPAHIAQALETGFAAYWTKPLDVGMFLSSLDALFAPVGHE